VKLGPRLYSDFVWISGERVVYEILSDLLEQELAFYVDPYLLWVNFETDFCHKFAVYVSCIAHLVHI